MKKYMFLIISLFCLGIMNVEAEVDRSVKTLTCNYENGNDEVKITYYNVGAATGDADLYYRIEYTKNNVNYCYSSSVASRCNSGTTPFNTVYGIYNYNTNFMFNGVQYYSIYHRLTRSSYQEDNSFNTDACSKGAFVTSELSDAKEIVLCETSRNSAACNSNSDDLFTLSSSTIGNNSSAGSTDTNYNQYYNDTRDEIERYCSGEEYNAELCEQAQANLEATEEAAAEAGISKEELEATYTQFKSGLEWETGNNCESYLGLITDDTDPAYYLNFAFQLLKYAAIVLLLVFTIVDFVKAVTSNKDDALKRALQTAVKRLIIAVIIFFLPTIINFILDLLGIISTDPTCGIE